MKFGILYNIDYHPEIHGSPQTYFEIILDQVAMLEQLGYDSVWFSEHHCSGYSFGNPAVIAAAAAARTTRIRLGIGVSLVPLHNPLRLAEEYAMVDAISRGRLEYGVGRGFLMQEYGFFGVPISESHGRYREGVDIIAKAWLSDGPMNHDGEFFKFQNYNFFPTPVQKPHPPIYASGSATLESYLWAGARGHNLATSLFLPDHNQTRANIQAYRKALVEHGHDPTLREVATVTQMYCASDKAAAMRDGSRYALNYYSFFSMLDRQSKDATVPDFFKSPDMEAMDRNNQVLFGEPAELVRRIGEARDFFGLDFLLMEVAQGGASAENVVQALRLFGEQVLPHFKATRGQTTIAQ